jgi:hypothetical protein
MSTLTAEEIELGSARIKQTVRWFPGVLLGLKRQIGKTRAIIELVHEDYAGLAVIFSPNKNMSEYVEYWYKAKYPRDPQPVFSSNVRELSGFDGPIYVDEWFSLKEKDQMILLATGRVVCRIGTEF